MTQGNIKYPSPYSNRCSHFTRLQDADFINCYASFVCSLKEYFARNTLRPLGAISLKTKESKKNFLFCQEGFSIRSSLLSTRSFVPLYILEAYETIKFYQRWSEKRASLGDQWITEQAKDDEVFIHKPVLNSQRKAVVLPSLRLPKIISPMSYHRTHTVLNQR